LDVSNQITTSTSLSISYYKFTYSTPGSLLRSGGQVPDPVTTVTTSVNNYTFGGSNAFLLPDCTYTFTSQARNNSTNENYGPSSISNTISTTNIHPTATFGSISFLLNSNDAPKYKCNSY